MKKQLESIIIVIILTLILWSCNKEKLFSKSEFEQAVFYEVFPEILDSVYFDVRLLPPPLPPPNILKEKGYDVESDYNKAYIDWKKSDEFIKTQNKWKKKRDSIKLDTTSIYLIVQDSVIGFSRVDSIELKKHFREKNIIVDTIGTKSNKNFRIDITELNTNNNKIKFIYRSAFPEEHKFWRKKHDIFIASKIGFNRILFDKNRSYGVLNFGYVMGILNGEGFRVFIKKNSKGKWVIDKIKGTWIS